jgi:microcystin-dependent protein
MADPYIGEIRIFAGTFAPQGWALCQGQTLSISTNTALFAVIGITYGGNGNTTFNLPNLAGRCVLGMGTSTTGTNYVEGKAAGTEGVLLTQDNLPAHTHPFAPQVNNANATVNDPTGAIPAVVNNGALRDAAVQSPAYTKSAATGSGATQQTGSVGQGLSTPIMQPYLVINYIIALNGIYPPRP